ncbi:hypothetical protein H2200_001268 [Cladophialophora chaetospira]|uniref:Tho complex subunit 7 n=1 Tax=Cladophialophora chaetospira TaxID=386627 RepID=A0AA38XKJ4_9EURO|nr:hypothetical protein H2200_001268 [Cladophialophora chaetospira]
MATFTVLDQAEEDKLHATRLLGIEERPYKRVSKRLLAPTTPINAFLARPPPSDDAVEAEDSSIQNEQFLAALARFREDVILDFAGFESSIARIQFLRAANTRERERYTAEKHKIEQTANDVRENLGTLRVQLDEAQKTLAVRKTYDVLAEKITRDEKLKVTRAEQHVNIEKLRSEIEELERESGELKSAWGERREQLHTIAGEGQRLRRIIRDEKEPEAGTEKDGDEEGEEGDRDRDALSNIGTPRPIDDAPTPRPTGLRGSGALTPRSHVPGSAAGTPRPSGDEDIEMDAGAVESIPTENVVAAGDVDRPASDAANEMDLT